MRFDDWLQWGINSGDSIVKKSLNLDLDGFRGDFFGEHSIDEPTGRGIMRVSKNKFIVGYTENRGWNMGSLEVEIDREKEESMVSTMKQTVRPGGKRWFKIVSFYNSAGLMRSELVFDDRTVKEWNLQHTASDFLG